jgi:hypothetical protein
LRRRDARDPYIILIDISREILAAGATAPLLEEASEVIPTIIDNLLKSISVA